MSLREKVITITDAACNKYMLGLVAARAEQINTQQQVAGVITQKNDDGTLVVTLVDGTIKTVNAGPIFRDVGEPVDVVGSTIS